MQGHKTMQTKDAAHLPMKVRDESKKTAFILDKSGVLGTFFQYSAQICSVAGMIIENAMSGKQEDPAAIGDKMRADYVSAAKHGKVICYRFGQCCPTRLEKYFGTADHTFIPSIIFDPSKNKERDHFKKIVKPAEDKDQFGGNECYPQDGLVVCVLCEVSDENQVAEILKETRAKIPDFDKLFEVYVNDN